MPRHSLRTTASGPPLTVLCAIAQVLLLLGCTMPAVAGAACDCDTEAQRAALMALYTATEGPSWAVDGAPVVDWATAVPLCNWTGVVCDGAEVREVLLNATGLGGTLPATFAGLGSLRTLSLRDNAIAGTLPTALGSLSTLVRLELATNQFNGPIPGAWSGLTNLVDLELQDNKLIGTLPDGFFGGMANLTTLILRGNRLSGPLPSSLGSCTKLQALVLNDNRLEGTIPAAWASLRNVKSLNLQANQLSGTLPAAIGTWASLETIELRDNHFEGSIPVEWGRLEKVAALTVRNNRLSGPLPVLSGWRVLKELTFEDNTFNGTLPDVYPTIHPQLTLLDVTNNRLEGTLPERYGQFEHLKNLKIGSNQFSGTLPAGWSQLGGTLYSLKFDNNSITGTVPEAYGDLVHLSELYGSSNALSGTLPSNFSRLSKLKILRLLVNNLTGTLPHAWGAGAGMPSMNSIDLSTNRLSGTLPPSWGTGMPELQYITLVSNRLTGTLPPEWGGMRQLQTFLVADNDLEGTLPDAFNHLSHMEFLFLGANRFSGTLPPSWSAFRRLQYLMLQQTNVSGTIPVTWDALPSFTPLFFFPTETALCGPLPPSWASTLPFLSFYYFAEIKRGMTIAGALSAMSGYPSALPSCPLPTPAPEPTTLPTTLPTTRRPTLNAQVAVVTATTVTGSVVGAGVAVVVSPVLGASVVRAARVVELLKCAGEGEDGAPPDADALRDAALGYLLAMVVPAVAVACVVVEARRRQRLTPSALRKGLSRLDVVLARWHLPGRFNCVIEALAPAALEVGLALVTLSGAGGAAPGDGAVALGAVCVVAAAASLLWFAAHVTLRFAARWRAHADASAAAATPRPRAASGPKAAASSALRRACTWLHASHPAGEWEAAPGRPAFVAAYGSLFDACRERRHWYLALETCLTVAVSVLAALSNADAVPCGVVLDVVGALQLAACAAMLWFRPYLARLTLATGLLLAVLAAVVAVLSMVPGCRGCTEAAIVLSQVEFWLIVALCLVDVSVRAAVEALLPKRPVDEVPDEAPVRQQRRRPRSPRRGVEGDDGGAASELRTSMRSLEPPRSERYGVGQRYSAARSAPQGLVAVDDAAKGGGMSYRARQQHNLRKLIVCIVSSRETEADREPDRQSGGG